MMSGGDLDGDVYMVIWDKKIVETVLEQKGNNFPEPMDDHAAWKEMYTEEIGNEGFDIVNSIAYYFQRDMLGQMANLHLNHAIQHGVDKDSTELASFLCSI